jgi:hypothetical protein
MTIVGVTVSKEKGPTGTGSKVPKAPMPRPNPNLDNIEKKGNDPTKGITLNRPPKEPR